MAEENKANPVARASGVICVPQVCNVLCSA